MSRVYKIAFCADHGPYVTRELQVPDTWEGSLEAVVDFLTPQWELGTALVEELAKAHSQFSIGHTRGLALVASKFRTPDYERWKLLRQGLPEHLLMHSGFTSLEPFWQYVLESMLGRGRGLVGMLEHRLVTMHMSEGLGEKYSEVFGLPSTSEYIPGLRLEWAHPTGFVPRYSFDGLGSSEGWRP